MNQNAKRERSTFGRTIPVQMLKASLNFQELKCQKCVDGHILTGRTSLVSSFLSNAALCIARLTISPICQHLHVEKSYLLVFVD